MDTFNSLLLMDPLLYWFTSSRNAIYGINEAGFKTFPAMDNTSFIEDELSTLGTQTPQAPVALSTTATTTAELQKQVNTNVSMLENILTDNNPALSSTGSTNPLINNYGFGAFQVYLAETNPGTIPFAGSALDQTG